MASAIQDKPKFRAEMPSIPGVPSEPVRQDEPEVERDVRGRIWQAAILGGTALVLLAGGWWVVRTTRNVPAQAGSTQVETVPIPVEIPLSPLQVTSPKQSSEFVEVGTVQELSRPWSSKRFIFRKRASSEMLPALVVRLPGAGERDGVYWGFSRQAPYGKCELELVTDLNRLASQYGYKSRYPMVGDPCSGTLYDPLRLGTVPGGAWVRGEVVQGAGLRPPVAIEIRVSGNQVIATQIE